MDQLPSPATIGFLIVPFALMLAAAILAAGTWVQAFSSRLIARHAFKRQLRGGLWRMYLLLAVPVLLVAAQLDSVGWPLLAQLVRFLGAAPLIRHFIRTAPQHVEEVDVWIAPSWGECLGLSAGSALALLVAQQVVLWIVKIVGLGVLFGVVGAAMQ